MAAGAEAASEVRSLYVHIPFCERKCEYCDFTSVAGKRREIDYVESLRTELRMLAAAMPGLELDTVFVGGGTPSFIEPELLASVLTDIHMRFAVQPDAEITLEANPSSVDEQRALVWHAAGFNRVSVGIQSLDDDCLRFLGRVHDAHRARDAVAEVRAAGFTSVNCDLIYAVPGLDDAHWRRSLEEVVALAPDHVSCYELTYEPQTPLYEALRRGRVTAVAAEPALVQHWIAVELLGGAGYEQYEISNFARPGIACRHNVNYWRNGYYAAAGVGAHGHLPAALAHVAGCNGRGAVAVRYWHGRGIGPYVESLAAGRTPTLGTELVDRAGHESERIMLGLRLMEGIRWQAPASPEVRSLEDQGLCRLAEGRLRVTRRGQEVLDQIIVRIAAEIDDPVPARSRAAG